MKELKKERWTRLAKSRTRGRGGQWFSKVEIGILAIFLLFVAWLAKPSIPVCGPSAEVNAQISKVRQLVLALRTFGYDENGQYPESFEVLFPDYTDDPSALTTDYTASGKVEPYIYLNGVFGASHCRTPLIISPALPPPNDDRRVVGFVSGSVAAISMTGEQVEAAKQGQWPPEE